MATQFERDCEARQERALRQKNIDKLRQMLERDEDIKAVMPHDPSNLDLIHEHQAMHEHLTRLRSMLDDEVRAYNKTYEATPEDLEGISFGNG